MERLEQFFLSGVSHVPSDLIGTEVETLFVNEDGTPISFEQLQQIFRSLLEYGWRVLEQKGESIVKLVNNFGDRILYDLGRCNVEVALAPVAKVAMLVHLQQVLDTLYRVAESVGAHHLFEPILKTDDNLFLTLDERDKGWLEVDGEDALSYLTRAASLQFTLPVTPDTVVGYLNRLDEALPTFLPHYPQDELWKCYIEESHAGYDASRYGAIGQIETISDYCRRLAQHTLVDDGKIFPFVELVNPNIPLFIRGVWWHFRLKRYGGVLCIEIRPIGRCADKEIPNKLEHVLSVVRG